MTNCEDFKLGVHAPSAFAACDIHRAPKRGVLIRAVAAALVLYGPAHAEKPPVDLSTFPEMSPEQTKPVIVAGLRRVLKDPGSLSDLMICYPPVKVKFKDGKPVYWTILMSLNARNSYGGYGGAEGYAAVFYSDKPVWIFSIGSQLPSSTRGCPYVPEDELKRLMQGR